MPVQDIDLGWKRITDEIRKLSTQGVKIGIQSDAPPEPDGADLVMVAAVQEFGSPEHNIPSRPFMRTTADRTVTTLPKVLDASFDRLINGGTAYQTLSQIGLWYQQQMQATLLTGPWVPNAPLTIARKKSSTPLIDTGHLRMSIRYALTTP